MTKAMTLEIAESLYEKILKQANQSGQTPESMVIAWIETAVKLPTDDNLLQLAGIFQSQVTDIGERHNEYVGKQLLAVNNE